MRSHHLLLALLALPLAAAHAASSPALPDSRAASASVPPAATTRGSDSTDVASTVTRFHEALARGDSVAALALLAPDAVILESGDTETVAEYRAHHLPADIAFAQAIKGTRGPLRVTVRGDVAWVSGTSVTQGEFRGRPVNSAGAELMVLARGAQGWRIVAIHWSSRRRQ